MANKIPEAAIWKSPPDQKRIREIQLEFQADKDGWIYRHLPDGTRIRWQRWEKWPR